MSSVENNGPINDPNNQSMAKRLITAGIEFNCETGEVHALDGSVDSKSIRLSPVNRRVLNSLLQADGETVSRAQLFDAVWPNQVVSDDALTRSISDLRAQLKPLTTQHPVIATIPKVGYRWLLPVNEGHATSQLKYPSNVFKQQILPFILAFILFLALLFVLLSWLQKDRYSDSRNLLILENENTLSLGIPDCLKQAISNHDQLRYLSDHAIKTHQGNPYPYFSNQFGVHWFIEHQLLTYRGSEQISFGLIDAKTGLVIFEQRYHLNPQEADQWCQSFISKVAEL